MSALLHLMRRNSIVRTSTLPIVSSGNNSFTLDPVAALDDLLVAVHRNAGGGPPAGPGGTLLNTTGNYTVFNRLASAGQTVLAGDTSSPNLDTMGAFQYRGAKLVTNIAAGSGSGTTVTFPSLTLNDPGRSWIAFHAGFGSSGRTLTAISTGLQLTGSELKINLSDTDGPWPSSSWSGVTGTITGGTTLWNTFSIEIEPI